MIPPHPAELPVVLVDDEEALLHYYRLLLQNAGIRHLETLSDPRLLLDLIGRRGAAALVLDLAMPHIGGLQLLKEMTEQYPEIPVIVVTATRNTDTAVACMRGGAFDYLVKPAEASRFVATVKHAIELRALRRDFGELKRQLLTGELEHPQAFASIITANRSMYALFQYIETVALSPEPVLITGETGVGKELLAASVHRLSGRPGRFVPLNAAGLDDNLFSDTLFGHVRGAFTGAAQAREGLVSQAAGGTLFLDEIGDLEVPSQVKLLRLLQEQAYYPLGADVQRRGNIRLVCATHRDLSAAMASGAFRQDLYYRLSVHQVRVPPLRERKDDIPLLTAHFLEQAAARLGREPPRVPEALQALLGAYHFPGNVRELRAMVMDAAAAHRGGTLLALDRFKNAMQRTVVRSATASTGPLLLPEGRLPTLAQAEEQLIREALRRAGDNQGVAAILLGISRTALNRRLAKLRGPGGPPGGD